MNNRQHILLTAVAVILSLLATGCSSSKKNTAAQYTAPTSAPKILDKAIAIAETAPFTTATVPLTATLQSPASMSVSGQASFSSEGFTTISLRILGLEVAAIYTSPDSIHILDKVHRQYISESTNRFANILPLNGQNIQDILLGRIFYPGKETVSASQFRTVILSDSLLKVDLKHTKTPLAFTLLPDGIVNNISAEALSATLLCTYSEIKTTEKGQFPNQISVRTLLNKKDISATIKFRWDKARFDSSQPKQWQQPKGYTRLQTSDLIKLLRL